MDMRLKITIKIGFFGLLLFYVARYPYVVSIFGFIKSDHIEEFRSMKRPFVNEKLNTK